MNLFPQKYQSCNDFIIEVSNNINNLIIEGKEKRVVIDKLYEYVEECSSSCILKCDFNLKDQWAKYRGNPDSNVMIVGEAPAVTEVSSRSIFTGEAGKVLNHFISYIGYNTDNDFYLTNTVKCRSIVIDQTKGNGTLIKNTAPTSIQCHACKLFLNYEIDIIKPKLIILLGKTAITNLFKNHLNSSMKSLSGVQSSIKLEKIKFDCNMYTDAISTIHKFNTFFLYHPAALLHTKKFPSKYEELENRMKKDFLSLKEYMDSLDLSIIPYQNNTVLNNKEEIICNDLLARLKQF